MNKPKYQNVSGEILTLEQASQRLNLGMSTVRQKAAECGAALKIGRSYRINIQRLTDYLSGDSEIKSNPGCVSIDSEKFKQALIDRCGSIHKAILMSYASSNAYYVDIKNGWYPAPRIANLKLIFTDEEIEKFTLHDKVNTDDGKYSELKKLIRMVVASTIEELITDGLLPDPNKEETAETSIEEQEEERRTDGSNQY